MSTKIRSPLPSPKAPRLGEVRQLMSFLGLVPKEDTTGERRRLGSITKAGNTHARWILIEVVQHSLLPPKVSTQLSTRQLGVAAPHVVHKFVQA